MTFLLHPDSPVQYDWIGGCVILVATGPVLQAPAANQLVSQQHATKVGIFARPFVRNKLNKVEGTKWKSKVAPATDSR